MGRTGRWLNAVLCLGGLGIAIETCPAADRKPNPNGKPAARKASPKTSGRPQHLPEAERDLKQSVKAWDQARSQANSAQGRVQKLHDQLRDKHAQAVGLPAALERVEAAKSAWDAAAKPVRERLKSNAEYQRSQQELEQAQQRLAAFKDRSELPDDDTKARLADAAKVVLNAKTTERRLLDDDPALQPLRERWTAAEQKLKSVHDELEQRIDGDRDFADAQDEYRQQKSASDKAKHAVDAGQRKLAQLKQRLALEQRQQQLKKTQQSGQRKGRSTPNRQRAKLR